MNRYIAAIRYNDAIVACDPQGNEHTIDASVDPSANIIHYREDPRSCSVQDIIIIEWASFSQLCANLKAHGDSPILIDALRYSGVEIEHHRYRSSVDLQSDGRWKCISSACKSRNHFTCEHAQYIGKIVPKSAVAFPAMNEQDINDLIDCY